MKVGGSSVGFMNYLVTLVTIGAGLNFGYETGIMAGAFPLKDFQQRFATGATTYDAAGKFVSRDWSTWLQGLITGFMSIGCGIGALTGGWWQGRIGTKYAVQVSAIWVIIGCVIKVASEHSWVQFGIGRMVSGYGIGMSSALAPVYQSELVAKQVRGLLGSFFQFAITLGILLAYIVAIACHKGLPHGGSASWRILVSMGFVFAMLQFVVALFTPESPRLSAQQGKYDEAKRAIATMHGVRVEDSDAQVEAEYQELIRSIEESKASNESDATWMDCFKRENSTCFRTIMGMMLQMGQQLCGGNYFFFYGNQVFSLAGGVTDPYVTQIILGAVNFVCTAPGLWLIEACGRRNTLFYGAIGCSFWLFVFAIAGVAGNTGPAGTPHVSHGIGNLMIVSGCLFVFFLACTWSPAVWVWCGENFGSRTRSKQAALSTATNWAFNFLLAFFTQPITSNIGFAYGFIFAAYCIVNALVVFFFMRETQGLTLEQVDMMYHDASCKPWNSRTWCPPGYSSRKALVSGAEIVVPSDLATAVATSDMECTGSDDHKSAGVSSIHGSEKIEAPVHRSSAATEL